MRRGLLTLAAMLGVGLISAPATSWAQLAAKGPFPVEGMWLSEEHDGLFSIHSCGNGEMLCGQLIGMAYDDVVPKDVWGRSECGVMMLTDFVQISDQRWQGHILDPRSGQVYQSRIWSPTPGVLKLRGFILGMPLLGQTQTWTRYNGPPIGPECKLPKDVH